MGIIALVLSNAGWYYLAWIIYPWYWKKKDTWAQIAEDDQDTHEYYRSTDANGEELTLTKDWYNLIKGNRRVSPAEPNKYQVDGHTPLMVAIGRGCFMAARWLILHFTGSVEKAYDDQGHNIYLDAASRDRIGNTALVMAITGTTNEENREQCEDLVKLLLEGKANPNKLPINEESAPPLYLAIEKASLDILRLMLEHKGDVDHNLGTHDAVVDWMEVGKAHYEGMEVDIETDDIPIGGDKQFWATYQLVKRHSNTSEAGLVVTESQTEA